MSINPTKSISNWEVKILRSDTISQSHNLTISQSHNLTISQSHNLAISQSHNLTISPSHHLTISQSHNLTISQSHNLTISQSHGGVASESQNLRISWFCANGARLGGNHALEHSSPTTVSQGNCRHFIGSWFSDLNGVKRRERSAQMWRRLRNVHVLVRAFGDCSVSLAMTHMRWLHGQSGHESTGCTRSVVHCVGGLRAWPIDMCSNKHAGRIQSETPTPCECAQARRQI